MANHADHANPSPESAAADEARRHTGAQEKQIYLRTVYPLNPGIPHSVDFPTGWRRD